MSDASIYKMPLRTTFKITLQMIRLQKIRLNSQTVSITTVIS
jgi:hypothetical protein